MKAREVQTLMDVERKRAQERQREGQRAGGKAKHGSLVAPVPPSSCEEHGKARDKVAKALGVSGKTVDAMLRSAEAIDTLESQGKHEEARKVKPAHLVRLLAEAKTIGEVKHIRDVAQAMAYLIRERGLGLQAQNDAAEIRLRAERRIGEMLVEMPKNEGARGVGVPSHDARAPRLADLGLTWSDSSRFQQMAGIDEPIFHQHIADIRSKEQELTTSGVLRLAKSLQQPGRADLPPLEGGCTVDDLHALVASGQKFGTVYADPPWQYGNQATRAATDNHYQTMAALEIAALPVGDLAAADAHLHLWTTNGFLKEALDIVAAWGFEMKSCFVWCKPQIGLGNYWRVAHEFLLLGVRGSCPFRDKALRSWAELDRDRHSAKPEQVRLMVERASPGPYLELCGRMAVEGWVVWGNEVSRDLFTQQIPTLEET